jgi:hypothetical protein
VFLGEPMEERRRGIGPAAAVHLDFQQQLRLRIDRCVQPLLLPIDFDLLLIDRDPRRLRRRRVALFFRERVRPVPNRSVRSVNTE